MGPNRPLPLVSWLLFDHLQQGLRIGRGGFHSGVSMINDNAICEEVLLRGHDKVVLNHKRSLLTARTDHLCAIDSLLRI
jgi:hypothetical protein